MRKPSSARRASTTSISSSADQPDVDAAHRCGRLRSQATRLQGQDRGHRLHADGSEPEGQRRAGGQIRPSPAPAPSRPRAKYNTALDEWAKFANTMLATEIRTRDGQKGLTYVPNGGLYFVDLDPKSSRYGCVKFTSSSLMTAGEVHPWRLRPVRNRPAADPARNVAVREERLGQKHSRRPEFFDVQHLQSTARWRADGAAWRAGILWQHAFGRGPGNIPSDGNFSTARTQAETAQLYETAFKGGSSSPRPVPRRSCPECSPHRLERRQR